MASTYQVLRRTSSAEYSIWEVVGEFTGVTAKQAERAAAASTDTEGTYVAVPLRSWHPKEYKFETATRIISPKGTNNSAPQQVEVGASA